METSKYEARGSLGIWLDKEIKRRGISRVKAANDMNMDTKAFCNNIACKSYPNLMTLVKYHDYFGISMNELVDMALLDKANGIKDMRF